jgi:integral membrane sensor domain MASE1
VSSLLTLPYLMPLLGGIVYVFAALFLKRAGEAGAETWQTIRVCNWTAALAFQPLLLLGGTFNRPSSPCCSSPGRSAPFSR